MEMSEVEVLVHINKTPYSVEETKKISYDDVLKVTKLPQGSTVVYTDTKFAKRKDYRAGFLVKGESIAIKDGLDISAFRLVDLQYNEDENGEEA
jgi:hypothetical protein